jgi:hypothetical protein
MSINRSQISRAHETIHNRFLGFVWLIVIPKHYTSNENNNELSIRRTIQTIIFSPVSAGANFPNLTHRERFSRGAINHFDLQVWHHATNSVAAKIKGVFNESGQGNW